MSQFRELSIRNDFSNIKLERWRSPLSEAEIIQLLLDLYPNAAAAYSLSKLNSNYTGAAVNVRRASDNATLDIGFTGTNLDITVLEAFCKTNTVLYQSDFSVDADGFTEENGTLTGNIDGIAGEDDTLEFVPDNTLIQHRFRRGNFLPTDGNVRIEFDYYIPLSNTVTDSIRVYGGGSLGVFHTVQGAWTSVSEDFTPVSSFFFIQAAANGLTVYTGNSSDAVYIKNFKLTQLTTNGYVTVWYDQSGNGANATQTVSSSQPQIVNGGSVITQYGKPAIEYNGTTTWLQANNMNVTDESKFSQLFVVKNTTAGTAVAFSGAAVLTDNQYSTSADDIFFGNTEGLYVVDNLNVKGYLNSIDVGSTGPAFTQIFNRLYFGSTNGSTSFAAGTIQAAILYDFSDDQSSNRVYIEMLLNNYYKLYPQGDRLLNYYRGAAAAFDLQLLDSNYTGSAVNVRRGSDNTTLDIGFNGVDLDTVALEAFCNLNTIVYQSDFTSGNEDLVEANGIGIDGETIAGVSDCYKFELTNGSNIHQILKSGFDNGQSMTVTFDYYIPSTNVELNALFPGFVGGTSQLQPSITDTWTSVTLQITDSNNGVFFIRGWSNSGQVFSADGDVFYLKNIQITQLTTNGYVTTWYDQSGNGYDAVQTVSSSQPQIVSNGSVILENGKPTISFDGVDDTLQYDFSPDEVQPFTLFHVRRYRNISSTYVGLGVDSTPNTGYAEIANGSQFRTYYGNYLVNGPSNTNQGLWYSLGNGASSEIGLDSDTAITGNAGTGRLELLSIGSAGGSAFFVPINTQSVIIYANNQSSNRTGIETALNDYYNIY